MESDRNKPPRARPKRRSGTVPFVVPSTIAVPRIALRVEYEAGQPTAREITVDGEECRIGSHPSNDVALNDPAVSRFHCRLSRTADGWRILDNDSLNGTKVNGVRVRDGDLPAQDAYIEVGTCRVLVSERGSVTEAEVPANPGFGDLVGTSVAMRRLFGMLDRVSHSEATVLIQGESGTGKEAIALEIVRRGPRANGPLMVVDCGAISPTVIESELFGHARGAFTGADRQRIGAFEEASGGTIVLDEIGELPLEMQPKLLRAIEAGQIRRLGENQPRSIDVRVIAATNRRLEREINHGRFREDLFFRLSVVQVSVPPLREHPEDIAVLVRLFLRQLGRSDKNDLFTKEVLADLSRHAWPGNVRELRNYVERAVVLDQTEPTAGSARASDSGSGHVVAEHGNVVAEAINLDEPFSEAKRLTIEHFERKYLKALLAWSKGNVSQAARKAGMDRMYLHRLVQRHGLKRGGSAND